MRPLIIIRRRTTRTLARLRSHRARVQAFQAAIWFGADRETAERIADCVR